MPHPSPIRLTLALVTSLLLFAVVCHAQNENATISGLVTDETGAVVTGATVQLQSAERGITQETTTNSTGIYVFPAVKPGIYHISVRKQGFRQVDYVGLAANTQAHIEQNFRLQVGSASESVTVAAEAVNVNTTDAAVSTLVDSNTVGSMPLSSRNYLQLTLLSPGATNVSPDGMRQPQSMLDSGRPYINGNREQANSFLLDGQINTETKNNEVGYTPSVDAVQEFNLTTQNASAEFGNYQGGVVSATIKSGTNSFHGSLFEYFRNDKLNANNYWAAMTSGLPNYKNLMGFDSNGVMLKPELRYNQFGATLGGFIIKNKLFFFADYQGQRLVNASATGAQVLTQSARNGDFGQLCTNFGGRFDASGFCTGGNQYATQLLNPSSGARIPYNNLAAAGLTPSPAVYRLITSPFYPLPMINSLNGNNYFFSSGHKLNNDQGDIKIDYNISQKDRLTGRLSQMNLRLDPFTAFPLAYSGDGGAIRGGSTEPVRNVVLNWTHTIGANLLNEARAGFNAVRFDQTTVPSSSLGNIGEQFGIGGANYSAPGLLNIGITGAGFGANASLGQLNLIQIFHDTQAQLEDNLTYTRGRHSLKFGFQYVRVRQDWRYNGNNGALGALNIAGNSGSGLSDFWLGSVGWSRRDTTITPSLFMDRGNVYGAYAQDSWRVANTLTLSLGLRFEDHTPLYEVHDRIVNFDIMSGELLTPSNSHGLPRALYNNYLGRGDFQPRVGFAWSPGFLGGKTVVRAGYAISTFSEGLGANEALSMNPPFGILAQAPGTTVDEGYPAPPAWCSPNNLSCYFGWRIRITDQNLMPAIVQQWNLTVQHQFTDSLTAQIGYVGQHGTHLANFEDLAQSIGLNAAGKIAKPGELIVDRAHGPYLGGGTLGSLYMKSNMNFGGGYILTGANMSNANQRYDALQALLQKRMRGGLEGQIAYTWSKCMSNSAGYYGTGWGSTNAMSSGGQPGWQNIYDPRSDWGPCYFDQAQIVSAFATYELPVGKGKRYGSDLNPVLNAIVGNWQLGSIVSFHTGNALSLNLFGNWWPLEGDSSLTNGIAPFTLSARPNCNGAINVVNRWVAADPATNTPGYVQWFDTSNVSLPPSSGTPWAPIYGTFGTCSVGNIRGPRYSDADLSFHKSFPLPREGTRLEFRMEALNAFNHPVFTFRGGPAGGSFDMPDNTNFGHITGSLGARQIQLALKFFF